MSRDKALHRDRRRAPGTEVQDAFGSSERACSALMSDASQLLTAQKYSPGLEFLYGTVWEVSFRIEANPNTQSRDRERRQAPVMGANAAEPIAGRYRQYTFGIHICT